MELIGWEYLGSFSSLQDVVLPRKICPFSVNWETSATNYLRSFGNTDGICCTFPKGYIGSRERRAFSYSVIFSLFNPVISTSLRRDKIWFAVYLLPSRQNKQFILSLALCFCRLRHLILKLSVSVRGAMEILCSPGKSQPSVHPGWQEPPALSLVRPGQLVRTARRGRSWIWENKREIFHSSLCWSWCVWLSTFLEFSPLSCCKKFNLAHSREGRIPATFRQNGQWKGRACSRACIHPTLTRTSKLEG